MIDHPAMPNFNEGLDLKPGVNLSLIIKQEGAELAFRSMVKWLEGKCTEHNPAPLSAPHYLRNLKRFDCPDRRESLRKAAGLEGEHD